MSIFDRPLNGKPPHTFAWWVERIKQYPLPEWDRPVRLFSDKEMKDKARRWRAEMGRAGRRRKNDTIPGSEEGARSLANSLFHPADAKVLLELLFKPRTQGFFYPV